MSCIYHQHYQTLRSHAPCYCFFPFSRRPEGIRSISRFLFLFLFRSFNHQLCLCLTTFKSSTAYFLGPPPCPFLDLLHSEAFSLVNISSPFSPSHPGSHGAVRLSFRFQSNIHSLVESHFLAICLMKFLLFWVSVLSSFDNAIHVGRFQTVFGIFSSEGKLKSCAVKRWETCGLVPKANKQAI